MKYLLSAIIITLLGGCSGGPPHAGLFVYKNDLFAVPAMSKGDLNHMKEKGAKAIVLVDHSDSEEAQASLKEHQEMCAAIEANCIKLDLKSIDQKAKTRVATLVNDFERKKIVVISSEPKASAFFIGMYASRFHNANDNEVDEIFAGLQAPIDPQIKALLLAQ